MLCLPRRPFLPERIGWRLKYITDAPTMPTIDFFGFCIHGYTEDKLTVYN